MNASPRGPRVLLVIVLSTILGLAAGAAWQWLRQPPPPSADLAATVFPQPRPLPEDFRLTDQDGRPLDAARLRGKWTFVFFGFTHCPDVCPTTLTVMARLKKMLAAGPDPAPVQMLFVSVDPKRDTPEVLKRYVTFFDPEFLGATAPMERLVPLTRSLGILFTYNNQGRDDGGYTVDHSAQILLFSPEAQWVAVFGTPHVAARMARTFQQIRRYHE